jgi:penicillin-binding protein-related factor A (putative recombinase)
MQLEKVIEREILDFLAMKNILAFKIKSQGTFDPIKKQFRSPSKYFKRGVSDILGIFEGRPLAIEVKSEKGRLSVHQKIFLQQWEDHGGITIVARSVKDVMEKLKACSKDPVSKL